MSSLCRAWATHLFGTATFCLSWTFVESSVSLSVPYQAVLFTVRDQFGAHVFKICRSVVFVVHVKVFIYINGWRGQKRYNYKLIIFWELCLQFHIQGSKYLFQTHKRTIFWECFFTRRGKIPFHPFRFCSGMSEERNWPKFTWLLGLVCVWYSLMCLMQVSGRKSTRLNKLSFFSVNDTHCKNTELFYSWSSLFHLRKTKV